MDERMDERMDGEMDASEMNRAAYDHVAAQWAAARSGFYGREEQYLDLLLNGLPAGAHVLDAGCGAGWPMAGAVLARGFRVTGVDQSRELLALARRRFPEDGPVAPRWVLSSLEDYPFDQPAAAVICWDTLFHIPRERHPRLLQRMAACLEPGGRIMLTMGGSAHPAFTDEMFGQTFFYDSHTPDETAHLLRGLGLTVLLGEFMNLPDTAQGGRDKGRYALVAGKR